LDIHHEAHEEHEEKQFKVGLVPTLRVGTYTELEDKHKLIKVDSMYF
jgi:hypothetical protein